MIFRLSVLLSQCVFLYSIDVNCQIETPSFKDYNDLYKHFELEYGSDPNIINGIRYYDFYANAEGHPFLEDTINYNTLIEIDGIQYDNIALSYDIFEQHLIVHDNNEKHQPLKIIINNNEVSSFQLNKRQFRAYVSNNEEPMFYEEVALGKISCLYHWIKTRNTLLYDRDVVSYKYSHPIKNSYLYVNGKFHQYKNNRTFCRLFSKDICNLLEAYLNDNSINIRTASNKQIRELINYCNSLSSNTASIIQTQ